jgi:hypothetical protein
MAELGITVVTSGIADGAVPELNSLTAAAGKAEAAVTKLTQTTTSQLQQAANQSESFARRIEAALNIKTPQQQMQTTMGRGEDIAAYGAELDRLRAKFNQAHAIMSQYRIAQTEIKQANAVGAISVNEMNVALERLRITTQRQVDAERTLRAGRTQPGGLLGAGGAAAGGGGGGGSAGMQKMMQTNMMYQLQDVVTTAAMGMNPAMIALQQGSQLAMNFGQSGGVKAGLMSMVGGLTSMLSLTQLLPIAIVGVGAAMYQWLTGSGQKVKTLDELTKEYTKSVNDLAKAYGGASVSVENFAAKSEGVMTAKAQQSRQLLEAAGRGRAGALFGEASSDDWLSFGGAEMGPLGSSYQGQAFQVAKKFKAFEEPIRALFESIKAGNPDMDSFDKAILAIGKSSPLAGARLAELVEVTDEARKTFADLGVTVEEMVASLDKMQRLEIARADARTDEERLRAVKDLAEERNKDAVGLAKEHAIMRAVAEEQANIAREQRDFATERTKSLEDMVRKEGEEFGLMKLSGAQLDVQRQKLEFIDGIKDKAAKAGVAAGSAEYQTYQLLIDAAEQYFKILLQLKEAEEGISRERTKAQNDAQIAQMNARTNAEKIAAAGASAGAGKVGGAQTDFEIGEAARLERARIDKEMADATRSRHQNLDDLIRSQQEELDLIGKTAGETAALREEYRMTDELRRDAAERGVAMDEKEIANIKEKTKAYGLLVDELNKQKLIQDLIFERSLLYMSQEEAAIARKLHGTGISTDSPIAGYMRETARIQEIQGFARDTASDLLHSLSDALVQGGDDLGKNLVKALTDSAQRALDKVLDSLINTIINDIMGTGGSSGGGLIGAFLGGGGGGGGGGFLANTTFTDFLKNAGGGGGGGAVDSSVVSSIIGSAAGTTAARTGNIPLTKIDVGGGQYITVASAYAERFSGLIADLKKAGYPITSLGEGGYSDRFVKGTGNLSQHAYGAAVDINPRQNPWAVGAKGNFGDYGIDPQALAAKHDLEWGGMWRKADAMHFQVRRGEVQSDVQSGAIKNVEDFNKSLKKVTDTTDKVVKSSEEQIKALTDLNGISSKTASSLSELSGGMSNLGKTLQSFMANPQGGGSSWFSALSGLKGGAGGAIDWMTSISPAATMDILGGVGGLYHSGGIVGSPSSSRYFNSMSPWLSAPRLHGGNMFSAGEYPAVLKQGEAVFPSVAAAKASLGGNTIVNVHNYAGASIKTRATEDKEGVTLDVIVDRMNAANIDLRGTASNNAIRGKFNVNDRMKQR